MPRRRTRDSPVPRRLDRRRSGGNATDAQQRPGRRRRGEVETIADRRVIALRLRRGGASYRQIAGQLKVDVATAYADIRAELADLRVQTVEEATELRELELQRFDEMTAGLWPQIRAGSPPAVTAAVRVSERRARLLGLDAPTTTRTELTGSVDVSAQARLKAEAQELLWLEMDELQELARASDKLMADAIARSKAGRSGGSVPLLLPAAAGSAEVVPRAPADPSMEPPMDNQGDASPPVETAPRDTT